MPGLTGQLLRCFGLACPKEHHARTLKAISHHDEKGWWHIIDAKGPALFHWATCFAESALEEEMLASLRPLHPNFFRESTAPDLLFWARRGHK